MVGDLKARILTIGTELTVGEVINANAAWVSLRLEDKGLRVFSHLTVRDDRSEIATALASLKDAPILIVTGGLGPTSDDITRQCLADFAGVQLSFNEKVWADLQAAHQARGLKVLEAHKHQCHFPEGSTLLPNAAGTALGFSMTHDGQQIFVLPGPPAELQRMWIEEVEPKLTSALPKNPLQWKRWTVLGLPESEVAQRVEEVIANQKIETGYRASYPYVKVKAYLNDSLPKHQTIEAEITKVLTSHLVGRAFEDVAENFLTAWPTEKLTIIDDLSEGYLTQRLFSAHKSIKDRHPNTTERIATPSLQIFANHCAPKTATTNAKPQAQADIHLYAQAEGFAFTYTLNGKTTSESGTLPFRIPITSERGRKAAVERMLWLIQTNINPKSR